MKFEHSLIKGELGELQIYFRKIPCINKNFWWSRFFFCWEIWKMDQNEVTKHFSVGNTFRQAMLHARIFLYLLRDDMN